jgi:proliferating cell nuclear antigen
LSSCFTEYDVKEETQIAINLGNLKQILRRASSNDMLSLELTEDNKLSIKLKGSTTRTFNLPIIELEEKEQKIPDLEFPTAITLPSTTLTNAIEDADIVAESVTLEVENGAFNIHALGDLSQAKIEIKSGDNIKIESSEKVKAKYSIEYLKKMIGASKLSDTVDIKFNNDYPLKLEFKVVDKLLLSFILAPRVEND